jgi:hypothetical protein
MNRQKWITIAIGILLTICLFMLSGCNNNTPVLSGRYESVDDSSGFLVFEGNTVTLFESGTEVRSGTYRFHNDTLILNWENYAEAYTLDEAHNTLFHGSSNHDNFGEVAFLKIN